MDKDKIDKLNKLPFEDALKKLENTVGEMESGNLPLEEMMKKYEEGQILASICSGKLKTAEKKIEILRKKTENAPEWESYEKDENPTSNSTATEDEETDEENLLF